MPHLTKNAPSGRDISARPALTYLHVYIFLRCWFICQWLLWFLLTCSLYSYCCWFICQWLLWFIWTWQGAKPRTPINKQSNKFVSCLICMLQDSVPAGSYNDPFLSSVCHMYAMLRNKMSHVKSGTTLFHPETKNEELGTRSARLPMTSVWSESCPAHLALTSCTRTCTVTQKLNNAKTLPSKMKSTRQWCICHFQVGCLVDSV